MCGSVLCFIQNGVCIRTGTKNPLMLGHVFSMSYCESTAAICPICCRLVYCLCGGLRSATCANTTSPSMSYVRQWFAVLNLSRLARFPMKITSHRLLLAVFRMHTTSPLAQAYRGTKIHFTVLPFKPVHLQAPSSRSALMYARCRAGGTMWYPS